MPSEYQRRIVQFLREYGAREVRVVPGGRHPHVAFTWRGREIRRAIHRNIPGHTDAHIIKIQELKRIMGEPEVLVKKIDEMEQVIAPPRPAPSADFATASLIQAEAIGSVAYYLSAGKHSRVRIRFGLPDSIAGWLGVDKHVRAERGAGRTWVLRRSADPHDPTVKRRGARESAAIDATFDEKLMADFEPFGSTPAWYSLEDDRVHVLLRADPRPMKKRSPAKSPPAPLLAPAPPSPPSPNSDEFQHRAEEVLRSIAEIQASTPYRLVRLASGAWAWRAPTISLPEEEVGR